MNIPIYFSFQIKKPVPGKSLKHMIQKRNSGIHPALTSSI